MPDLLLDAGQEPLTVIDHECSFSICGSRDGLTVGTMACRGEVNFAQELPFYGSAITTAYNSLMIRLRKRNWIDDSHFDAESRII